MDRFDTEIGGEPRQFPSTVWSVIREAQTDDAKSALSRLLAAYWKPIYHCIRDGWAKRNEEAKDLTQEFILQMLERDLVGGADRDAGSFRSYVKAALRHFMLNEKRDRTRLKRGGEETVVSLDAIEEDLAADSTGLTPEEILDRHWMFELLGRARARLRERLDKSGQRVRYQVYECYDLSAGAEPSYREVADRLGLTVGQVTEHLFRARQEVLRILRETIREYVRSDEDVESELDGILGT